MATLKVEKAPKSLVSNKFSAKLMKFIYNYYSVFLIPPL